MSSNSRADSEHSSADQLFATFKAGHEALGKLLNKHRAYLLKIAIEEADPATRVRVPPSEMVQDVFVNILTHLKKSLFAVETTDDLRKWLRRACLNEARNHHRDQTAGKRNIEITQPFMENFDPAGPGQTPSSECADKEWDSNLERKLATLGEADRMLFRLRRDCKMSHRALAELLYAKPTEAERMAIGRRLADLYVKLAQEPPEPTGHSS